MLPPCIHSLSVHDCSYHKGNPLCSSAFSLLIECKCFEVFYFRKKIMYTIQPSGCEHSSLSDNFSPFPRSKWVQGGYVVLVLFMILSKTPILPNEWISINETGYLHVSLQFLSWVTWISLVSIFIEKKEQIHLFINFVALCLWIIFL